MRLFCLAHAGGSAGTVARVIGRHVHTATVVPVERPGRGSRWREPAYHDWPDLLHDLVGRVAAEVDAGPYGLFGHSFGALLAFELAHRLERAGAPPPRLLVVSGRNPPHLTPDPAVWGPVDQSDVELFTTLVALGGASARAAGPLTYQMFLPALRADLRLSRGYVHDAARGRLAARLVVVYGRDDPLTSASVLRQWSGYSSSLCTVHSVPGGHFFLFDRPSEVAQILDLAVAGPGAERGFGSTP